VHGSSLCVSCHRVHESSTPTPAACDECHGDVKSTHGTSQQGVTEACTTCHEHQHAAARDARGRCDDCHREQKPIVPETALFADGHAECVACHRPHSFAPAEAVACRSCHETVHVLGGARVAAHRPCANCHAPHDVKGTAERACARCHASVHSDHPVKGAAGTCVGCHDPHPSAGSRAPVARACGSCHPSALSDHGLHSEVTCVRCHEPHHFALDGSDRKPCATCHAQEVSHSAVLAGHAACEGCHRGLPHHPSELRAACETCHGAEQRAVRTGHQQCLGCHEPHAGGIEKPCATCHREEHREAPRGHRRCTDCHQPHTGAATVASCASCHAPEASSPHGNVQGGCASCHRAHGPGGRRQPPSCASCHATASLPGLHAETRHQACSQCHTAHGAPDAVLRDGCLGCHADRVRHFPNAARCTGCHLFGPNR
jgi:hypothetical protein